MTSRSILRNTTIAAMLAAPLAFAALPADAATPKPTVSLPAWSADCSKVTGTSANWPTGDKLQVGWYVGDGDDLNNPPAAHVTATSPANGPYSAPIPNPASITGITARMVDATGAPVTEWQYQPGNCTPPKPKAVRVTRSWLVKTYTPRTASCHRVVLTLVKLGHANATSDAVCKGQWVQQATHATGSNLTPDSAWIAAINKQTTGHVGDVATTSRTIPDAATITVAWEKHTGTATVTYYAASTKGTVANVAMAANSGQGSYLAPTAQPDHTQGGSRRI